LGPLRRRVLPSKQLSRQQVLQLQLPCQQRQVLQLQQLRVLSSGRQQVLQSQRLQALSWLLRLLVLSWVLLLEQRSSALWALHYRRLLPPPG